MRALIECHIVRFNRLSDNLPVPKSMYTYSSEYLFCKLLVPLICFYRGNEIAREQYGFYVSADIVRIRVNKPSIDAYSSGK